MEKFENIASREMNMVYSENQEAPLRAHLGPDSDFSKHHLKDDKCS